MSKQMSRYAVGLFAMTLIVGFAQPTARADDETPESKPTKEDPRAADVRKFIDRYFRTWSNREMDAYGEGFLREAVIQYLGEGGQVSTQATAEFLADQRRYQAMRP